MPTLILWPHVNHIGFRTSPHQLSHQDPCIPEIVGEFAALLFAVDVSGSELDFLVDGVGGAVYDGGVGVAVKVLPGWKYGLVRVLMNR